MAPLDKITLCWHSVATNWDMREFQNYGLVTAYTPANKRHQLFLTIKLGDSLLYRGPWGPELLRWSPTSDLEFYGTRQEAERIHQWIRDNLYECIYPD